MTHSQNNTNFMRYLLFPLFSPVLFYFIKKKKKTGILHFTAVYFIGALQILYFLKTEIFGNFDEQHFPNSIWKTAHFISVSHIGESHNTSNFVISIILVMVTVISDF